MSLRSPLAVIIPALARDAHLLHRLLTDIGASEGVERVVAVPGDELDALDELRRAHSAVHWVGSARGRARQMNAGAERTHAQWLLFLHADSRLSAGWLDEVVDKAAGRGALWGCFRFALDSPAWQARLLEAAVRARVAMWSLPYGDQGVFVRRDVFGAVSGYADLPLMEDVRLARDLARLARPWRSRLPLVTSARRWTREGWLARSRRNLWLLVRYLAGADAARLAREYSPPGPVLVVAPRPMEAVSAKESEGWNRGLDGLSAIVASTRGLRGLVPLRWADLRPGVLEGLGADLELLPLSAPAQPSDLGALCEGVAGHGSITLLLGPGGTNIPDAVIRHVSAQLEHAGADVVLGTDDKGCCRLFGLAQALRPSLRGLNWATADLAVAVRSRARGAACSLSEVPIPPQLS
ncbi:MAG: TIGR04283 family arsenosugar biosynthesis glycosyltransferase [Vicinamibacterales bacterium]